jgi:hypothetical protein
MIKLSLSPVKIPKLFKTTAPTPNPKQHHFGLDNIGEQKLFFFFFTAFVVREGLEQGASNSRASDPEVSKASNSSPQSFTLEDVGPEEFSGF